MFVAVQLYRSENGFTTCSLPVWSFSTAGYCHRARLEITPLEITHLTSSCFSNKIRIMNKTLIKISTKIEQNSKLEQIWNMEKIG
jgi:hypothetical protein